MNEGGPSSTHHGAVITLCDYFAHWIHRRGATVASTRATGARFASYSLPSLPYDVTALEPIVNTEIMTIHHTKHHQVPRLLVFAFHPDEARPICVCRSALHAQQQQPFWSQVFRTYPKSWGMRADVRHQSERCAGKVCRG